MYTVCSPFHRRHYGGKKANDSDDDSDNDNDSSDSDSDSDNKITFHKHSSSFIFSNIQMCSLRL